MKWLVAIALVCGCAKKSEPPPSGGSATVPMMSAAEVKRGQDACKTYVDQACACADKVPAMKQGCELAKALPEAVRISVEVAASPDSTPHDVISAQSSARKTVKECIEQTAKLPSLGCP